MEAVEWQMAVNPSSARTTASHLRALSRGVAHKTRAQRSGGSGGLDDDVAALVAQLAAVKADMRREQDSAMDNARRVSANQQQRRGDSSSAAAWDRSSSFNPPASTPSTNSVAGVEQALLNFIAQKQAALEASKAELQRSLQLTREAEQRLAAQSALQQQQQLNGTLPNPPRSDIASPTRSAAAPLQRTAGLSTHRLHPTPRAYRTPSPVLPASDAEDPSSLSTASLLAALPHSRKTLLDLFRNSDVQCTGTVSTRDFARCLSLATARELTPAQRSALIARLDRNGAGEVRYINLVNALDEAASSSQSNNGQDGTGGVTPSSVFDETKLFAAPPPPPPAIAYVPLPPFGVFDPEVTAARLSRVPPARSVAIERRSEVRLRDADGHFVHPADAADSPASFATLMAAASGGTMPALDYFPRPIGFVETHAYTLGDSVLPANPIAQQHPPEAAPAPDVLDARSPPGAALSSLAGRLGHASERTGGVNSPAAAHRFRALMHSLDRDQDRAVTHREFVHGLEQVGLSLDGPHSAQLFRALDPQATGFVRYEQVADIIAQHTQNRTVQQQQPIPAFDSPRPAVAAAPSLPAPNSDSNGRNDGNGHNDHLIFHRVRSPTAAAAEELANGVSHANFQRNTDIPQSSGYDRDAVEPQSQFRHGLPVLPVEYPSSYATLTSTQPQQHPPRRSRSRSSSISSVRSVRSSSSSAASTSSRARRSSFGGRDARPFDAATTTASFHRSPSARSSRPNSFSSQIGPEAHPAPTDGGNDSPLQRGRARTTESDSATQPQRSSSVGPASSRHHSPPLSDAALAVRDDSFKILRLSRAPPVPSRARHALQSRAGAAATAAMPQQQQQSSPQEFVVHHAIDDSPPATSAAAASSPRSPSAAFASSRSPPSHAAGLSSTSRSYIGFGADSPSGDGRRHSSSATLPLFSPLSAGASTPRQPSHVSQTGVGAWSNQRARDFYHSQWTLG